MPRGGGGALQGSRYPAQRSSLCEPLFVRSLLQLLKVRSGERKQEVLSENPSSHPRRLGAREGNGSLKVRTLSAYNGMCAGWSRYH